MGFRFFNLKDKSVSDKYFNTTIIVIMSIIIIVLHIE